MTDDRRRRFEQMYGTNHGPVLAYVVRRAGSPQVFDSVAAPIENNPELPTRLSAALHGVLAQLPSVRLGHATSLAGQKVLSLYQTEDGYLRREIFISPVTYA